MHRCNAIDVCVRCEQRYRNILERAFNAVCARVGAPGVTDKISYT